MVKKNRVLAGIDVGTTKICSVIAQVDNGYIRVASVGTCPSTGLKKGVVVNLTDTIQSLRRSLELAEHEAQTEVDSAFVSMGGIYVQGLNRSGEVEIRNKSGEIGPDDVIRAIADAKSVELPRDREIIHALTQNFTVDGQEDIRDPQGLMGRRLSVNLHLVLNATAAVQNIVNAINKAGVTVNGVVMQQLASAEAVLTSDEKELGVIILDIGGGTTDFAFYRQGSIWHSAVLPIGGDLVTKDIAIGLKVPLEEAELLKKEQGTVFTESVAGEEILEISEVGTGHTRTLYRRHLCEIIQARCEEILVAVRDLVDGVHMQRELITGTVITGGGSLLHGLLDRAEQILDMPVRAGQPINLDTEKDLFFDPSYATALGLLRYARDVQGVEVANGAKTVLDRFPKARADRLKKWFLNKIT